MAFFEEFKARAAELAQAGVAKSKVLAEIAKLKAANLSEKEIIHKAYLEMGRIYYAEKGSTPDAAYASSCTKVRNALAAIKENNAKIADLKEGADETAVPPTPEVEIAPTPDADIFEDEVPAQDDTSAE